MFQRTTVHVIVFGVVCPAALLMKAVAHIIVALIQFPVLKHETISDHRWSLLRVLTFSCSKTTEISYICAKDGDLQYILF